MEKLSMNYTFKKGKYANKTVADLVGTKGQILSMIKEGYDFDDEVLTEAHIKKSNRDEKVYSRVSTLTEKPLPKETASIKQILSELHTLNNVGSDIEEDSDNITTDNYYEGEDE